MKRLILIGGLLMATNASASGNLPDFDSLWNYNQPAETEVKFRELLPAARAANDTAYEAELLTQIARTRGLQRDFPGAAALLDSIAPLLQSAGERPHVRYLLERGRVLNSSGKPQEALPLFTEAWERAERGGFDFFAVDAAHMVAIVVPTDEQTAWNLKAVALAEKSDDPRARNWLGSLYNNMGWTFFDQKQYDSALDIFRKALAFRETQGKPVEIRIARWCVAKTLRMQGQVEAALQIQQELLREWQESGEEMDGYVYEELAECLWSLGREDEARPYFAQAYAALSKDPWLVENEAERLTRLQKLGEKD